MIARVVITFWRSVDSIRGFAGSDLEKAVVADEATALLAQFDRRVRHYEVALNEVAQSGVAQPGVAQPGVAQPGVAQPGVAQPGVAQSEIGQGENL